MDNVEWSFVLRCVGFALLGSLVAGIGSALAAADVSWGDAPLIAGSVLAFSALWSLGWHLAFPGGLFGRKENLTVLGLIGLPVLLVAALAIAFSVVR